MDPEILRKFQKEVEEYVELHQDLKKKIPTVTANATSEEIDAHRKKMTDAIREERKDAKRGDIFRPKVEAAFRYVIHKELSGPQGPAMLRELRAGNPRVEGVPRPQAPNSEVKGRITVAVNAIYPDALPLSSVPASLLLKLPPLPEQVKYRFVGRELILRDTEANVILDFIPDAVPPGSSLPR
jgi:hypothetical protein